jgi:hypothetical protein
MCQFLKAFIYHVIFFGVLGPLTPLLIAVFERSFILSTNMAFLFSDKSTIPRYLTQVVVWACTVVPIILMLIGMTTAGERTKHD